MISERGGGAMISLFEVYDVRLHCRRRSCENVKDRKA